MGWPRGKCHISGTKGCRHLKLSENLTKCSKCSYSTNQISGFKNVAFSEIKLPGVASTPLSVWSLQKGILNSWCLLCLHGGNGLRFHVNHVCIYVCACTRARVCACVCKSVWWFYVLTVAGGTPSSNERFFSIKYHRLDFVFKWKTHRMSCICKWSWMCQRWSVVVTAVMSIHWIRMLTEKRSTNFSSHRNSPTQCSTFMALATVQRWEDQGS